MSNELVQKEQSHVAYIDSKKDVIVKMLGLEEATPQDLDVAFTQFKRTRLDPVTRQIYAMINKGKLSIMASIDGLRLIAERTGSYEGQTAPQWCGSDGVWKDVWLSAETPKACRIGVYKTKFREALYAIALFEEYAGKQTYDDNYGKFKKGDLTYMWAKMPALMIAKVAEALALRKAFPNEMSGIYSTEEMDQAPKDVSPAVNIEVALQGAKTEAINVESMEVFDHGEYINTFGSKHKGKKIKDIFPHEHESMIKWLKGEQQKGEYKTKSADAYLLHAEAYLQLNK